jgi:hypothetical protein
MLRLSNQYTMSEDFSSRVAECTRLILVYDEFGGVKEG